MKKNKKLPLRRLLLDRLDWIDQRLYANAERNGYGDVTPAMGRLFTHLVGKPVGLSELSRRLSVSRQAVHQLASEAARMGYVEFFDSEADARVKLLRFTPKGRRMSASAEKELGQIEEELAAQIGHSKLTQLKLTLSMPWGDVDPN